MKIDSKIDSKIDPRTASILLVRQSRTMVEPVSKALAKYIGVSQRRVYHVYTLSEALSCLHRRYVSLVLVENELPPDNSGAGLIRNLRQESGPKAPPMVLTTLLNKEETNLSVIRKSIEAEARKAGAIGVLDMSEGVENFIHNLRPLFDL